MQVYAYFSSFSIAIGLLRFYRILLLWNLLQLIAVYCFIAIEFIAVYRHLLLWISP